MPARTGRLDWRRTSPSARARTVLDVVPRLVGMVGPAAEIAAS